MIANPDEELVVLLADDGTEIGTAPKRTVHHADTPLHLAFSCYLFDRHGRFLMTRRALGKTTFPGVWTNSCCGHPAPGESLVDAARRRSAGELGVGISGTQVALPRFRYTARMNGVVENEICPVLLARTDDQPDPDPGEVCDTAWIAWPEFVDRAKHDPAISPWARLQVAELLAGRHVDEFLSAGPALTTSPPTIGSR